MSQTVASALNNKVVTFVDIDHEYNCVICMQIADEPVRCSGMCAGIFCNGCMQQALTRSTSCPLCTKTNITVFRDVVLRNQIMKHQVNCINKSTIAAVATSTRKRKASPNDKCIWIGKYDELVAHLNQCEYQMIACTNQGCADTFERRELQTHQGGCLHRTASCDLCGDIIKVTAMEGHLEQCPKVIVSCECGSSGTREAIAEHVEKDCLLTEIQCEVIGCGTNVIRRDYEKHQDEAAKHHVRLLSATVEKLAKDIETKVIQVKWKISNLAAKMQDAGINMKSYSSPRWEVYFHGHHALYLRAMFSGNRLELFLQKDEDDPARLNVSGTTLIVNKTGMPDIKCTLGIDSFLGEPDWELSLNLLLPDVRQYNQNDSVSVVLNLKLKKDDKDQVLDLTNF